MAYKKKIKTLFNSLFGVNYHMAMLFGAAIIIIYTVMGGFMAVSTTDLIQSVGMSIALVIIVFFGISKAGGWDAVMDNAKSLTGYLSMTQAHNMADNTSSPYSLLTIFSTVAWILWNASYSSAFYGYRRGKEAGAFQKDRDRLGCDLHVRGNPDRYHRLWRIGSRSSSDV